MRRTHPPLDREWVDRIFARLTLNYGRRFMSLWDGMDVDDVKTGWAIELSGTKGEAIAYALEHLPAAKATDLPAFKELCRQAPAEVEPLALPAPIEVDPVAIRKVADQLAVLKQSMQPVGDMRAACAARVAAIAASGRRLTKVQREFLASAPAEADLAEDVAERLTFPANLPGLPNHGGAGA